MNGPGPTAAAASGQERAREVVEALAPWLARAERELRSAIQESPRTALTVAAIAGAALTFMPGRWFALAAAAGARTLVPTLFDAFVHGPAPAARPPDGAPK